MNGKTLFAIATAVAVLFAGLGAVGAVAADQSPEQPGDDELPESADEAADHDRDADRTNESDRDQVREHVNDTDGEYGPHHAGDGHGPHHAGDGHGPHHADDAVDRPGDAGPMWGVSDRVPNHVTQMHKEMKSYFDEEPPYRFGETIRSIAGGEHPWNDDHPRDDRADDNRHGNAGT
ncbi:hypothetical protein AArcSl_0052 [Halalkaliarchaeum desulfuricum]|uniref:Uncharacterized protein n=1 Tax=Halalkaliarchaeum desulfuricum TaxID=2055893 RepID=A0A343TF38_9EURY|nr:hypothetical protein [Halalkaliarchaeum desulfuricum]AUX07710.1 hypothetical protein AArcSl_0052 [Halalkaliarchaeum desulfuricum]